MKGFSRRTVIENKYVTFLIDSTCLNLVKFEFEILFNYLWQLAIKINELYITLVLLFYFFQLPMCSCDIFVPAHLTKYFVHMTYFE